MIRFVIFLSLGLAVPLFSIAQDGAFEINQACVEEGCFDGDDPGFPVNIMSSGVYKLTSSLTVGDSHGILVNSGLGPVEIDLNGYAVIGPNECSGEPVTKCNEVTQERGVIAPDGVSVKNGSVSGFEIGVDCTGCRMANLHISDNTGSGATAAVGANETGLIARNCIFESNFYHGVRLKGEGNLVEGSIARFNGSAGITGSNAVSGVVRNNTISNNEGTGEFVGINFGANVLVTGNSFERAFNGGVSAEDNSCADVKC